MVKTAIQRAKKGTVFTLAAAAAAVEEGEASNFQGS
jgi:hypothetical protein